MPTSRHNFLIANFVLIVLIGTMIWYLSTRGQTEFASLPEPQSKPAKTVSTSPEPTYSTDGLSEKEIKEIEALQTQLDAEKEKAKLVREQIRARQIEKSIQQNNIQNGSQTASAISPGTGDGLEIEQQKVRIAQMIEAQLKGAAEENARLAKALALKNREVETVRQQNTELSTRLSRLDSSAQSLLASLIRDGERISSSDQDYLGAIQDLANETSDPVATANLSDTDLINRVEVPDSGDSGTVAAELRSRVNQLMNEPAEGDGDSPKVNNQLNTAISGQAGNIQNSINDLIARNVEQDSQQQFRNNQAYLESLTPMEEERRNETRWVTVRQGDTLYDIAVRVYEDGWLYSRIFEANPQVLSNPDRIKPGQRLRVPL